MSHVFGTQCRGGTLCNIHIIYTSLKSTFRGIQVCRRHFGSIFIPLAVVAFQNREITRNSDKVSPYSSSRSSKVIDLCVNRKHRCDFLLVINSNFGRIFYRTICRRALIIEEEGNDPWMITWTWSVHNLHYILRRIITINSH